MSNWPYLTSKALEVIQNANQYLANRESWTMDQAERESIAKLREDLSASAETIAALQDAGAPDHNPANNMLVELLDLTQQHIQSLHETDNYLNVKVAFSSLDNQLRLLADTHGPGSGNPIGWPR